MFDWLCCVTLALTIMSDSLAYLSHTQIQRLPVMDEWLGQLSLKHQQTGPPFPTPKIIPRSCIAQDLAIGVSERRRSQAAGMEHWALNENTVCPTPFSRADPLSFHVCTKYLDAFSYKLSHHQLLSLDPVHSDSCRLWLSKKQRYCISHILMISCQKFLARG